MLSKSKLKKLKTELSEYGYTLDDLAKEVDRSVPHLLKIFKGDKYEYPVVKKFIDLRDAKKLQLTELEDLI